MLFSSYEAVQKYLGKKGSRPYPIGKPRNTRIIETYHGIAIRYCQTSVVMYQLDGIVLNTNGWYTVTTKRRINDAVAGNLFQSKYVWYYHDPIRKTVFKFFDGMKVDYEGRVLNPPQIYLDIFKGQLV